LVPTFNTKQQGLIHYAVCPSDGTFTRNLSLFACERPQNCLTNNNNNNNAWEHPHNSTSPSSIQFSASHHSKVLSCSLYLCLSLQPYSTSPYIGDPNVILTCNLLKSTALPVFIFTAKPVPKAVLDVPQGIPKKKELPFNCTCYTCLPEEIKIYAMCLDVKDGEKCLMQKEIHGFGIPATGSAVWKRTTEVKPFSFDAKDQLLLKKKEEIAGTPTSNT